MAQYQVRYYECYEGYYEIEASSKKEAKDKIREAIFNGKENGPEECYASGAEVTLIDNDK